MTTELNKLINERDEYRANSVKYTQAAEKIDKQVNRLKHFLSDYDSVEIEVPTKVKSNGQPSSRTLGLTVALNEYFKAMYPDSVSLKHISDEIVSQGLNVNSISSALARMETQGKIEVTGHNPKQYRLVLDSAKVSA